MSIDIQETSLYISTMKEEVRVKDKVAIVTGGASGIGREICLELGRRKVIVIVADINEPGAQKTASEIVATGGRAKPIRLDVSKADQVQAVVDETVREQGRLDYMFNNAGIAIGCDSRDMTLDHWRRIMDINLWGVIYGTNAAYQVMTKQGFGHIVNTSSIAGLIPFPVEIGYTTTKFAVVGLSQALRVEGHDLGVKVSVVCPGVVATPIYETAELIGASMDDVMAMNKIKIMPAEKAARVILKGVESNRAIIVIPRLWRLLWILYRLCPSLIGLPMQKACHDFRALRKKTENAPISSAGGGG